MATTVTINVTSVDSLSAAAVAAAETATTNANTAADNANAAALTITNKQNLIVGGATRVTDGNIQNGVLNASGTFIADPNTRSLIDYPITAGEKITATGLTASNKYGVWKDSGGSIIGSVFLVTDATILTAPATTATVSLTVITIGDGATLEYLIFKGNADADFAVNDINGLTIGQSTESNNIDAILTNGSDAFVHANRMKALGVNTKELVDVDKFITTNKDAYFALAPYSAGVGKIGVQIPDADANDGAFVRASTATRIDKFGVIRDVATNEARLSYENGIPSLRFDRASTNLLINSIFDGAVSGVSGGGTLPTGFSGTNNGDITVIDSAYENGNALVFTSSSNRTFASRNINITAGTYTLSAKITVLEGSLPVRDAFIPFDVSSVFTEVYYANGVEIGATDTLDAGSYKMTCILTVSGAGICDVRVGAGCIANVTAKVVVDTPQFEALNESTSYIPTTTSGTASRAREDASNLTVPFQNREGIINLKVSSITSDGISDINLSDGTNNNRVRFRFNYSVSTALRVEVYIGNAIQGILVDNLIDISKSNLVSLQLQDGNYKLSVNNVVVDSTATINKVPPLTRLDFHAALSAGSSPFRGNVEYVTITPITAFGNTLIKVNLYGDSITEQDYWQPYVRPEFPQCNIINKGVGGSTIANTDTDSFANPTRIATLDTDADFVVIMGFTNDFSQNVPIGAITDTGDTTAYGGLIKTLERVIARCTNAQMVLMTPIYRDGQFTANGVGAMLEDYREVMREVARVYQVKLIEMSLSGINQWNSSTTIPDGVHPREEGGLLMAKLFNPRFAEII